MIKKNDIIENYQKIKLYYHDKAFLHPSYHLEIQLLDYIKQGNLSRALETLNTINRLPRAMLAKEEMRSIKNSLICSCTIFTRAVIESGVNPEDAYGLSDACIQKIESINNIESLKDFEYSMLTTFINLRNEKNKKHTYSDEVEKAIQYIYNNIFKQLSLEEISNYVYLSPNYLSTKFKQEVGISLSDFINKTKINESKYLLAHSNTKISDIALIFNFCNQSYYNRIFKKFTGITPLEFKNLKYKSL